MPFNSSRSFAPRGDSTSTRQLVAVPEPDASYSTKAGKAFALCLAWDFRRAGCGRAGLRRPAHFQARFIHIQCPRCGIDPIVLDQLHCCNPQLFQQTRSHCARTSPFRSSPPQLLYVVSIKRRRFLCHLPRPPLAHPITYLKHSSRILPGNSPRRSGGAGWPAILIARRETRADSRPSQSPVV